MFNLFKRRKVAMGSKSTDIDRYLRGKMTPQEEQKFLLSIKRNKRLRRLALIKALFIKQIKACRSKVTNTNHDKRSDSETYGR